MSTIASISTAPGIGGIGIVRISGDNTFDIIKKIFTPKTKKSLDSIKGYTIKYGNIVDGNEIIDEVLVSFFVSPKSYTTEDMCEINTHGGTIVTKKILEICLKNGANLAEPGEFTKRAFLNGRIDLLQAESVIDIINAKSDKEAKQGIKSLEGNLSNAINSIKKEILDVMVNIEVSIDYPEYDEVGDIQNNEVVDMLNVVKNKLITLEKSFDNGRLIKEGIKTAIIGKPNAGKSSLLNFILNEDRAIVTEFAGTTRDTIEEYITVGGIPLNLIDTAGIRETEDFVEKIGIEKSKKAAEDAELIIAIIDSSKDLDEEDFEILNLAKVKKSIIVLNKIDLNNKINKNNNNISTITPHIVEMSALKKVGIEELYNKIEEMFNFEEISLGNEIMITNIRHKNLISHAIENSNKSIEALNNNMPIDIITIFIKDILEDLAEITGESVNEDIINEIFAKFCLGK